MNRDGCVVMWNTLLSDPAHFLTLAFTFLLFGLLGLLFRTGRPWLVPLVTASLSAVLAAFAALGSTDQLLIGPATLVAVVSLTVAVFRSSLPATTLRLAARVLTAPHLQAVLLLLLGVGLTGWQIYALDAALERNIQQTETDFFGLMDVSHLQLEPVDKVHTDAGHEIALLQPSVEVPSIDFAETKFLQQRDLSFHVIQTGPAEAHYNCHGWIFTGGRFWVSGESVDTILRDNNYVLINQPSPGDLAVFRDESNKITHTALVRAVRENGQVVLESKWGRLGCYIHTADRHAYQANECKFYRTSRGTHLLRGLSLIEAGG